MLWFRAALSLVLVAGLVVSFFAGGDSIVFIGLCAGVILSGALREMLNARDTARLTILKREEIDDWLKQPGHRERVEAVIQALETNKKS